MINKITRFAPSPTMNSNNPIPHLGFYRTLYHNWLGAVSTEGKFILRIDDTDKERSNSESENVIIKEVKELCGNNITIIKQSERTYLYDYWASKLMRLGYAIEDEGCIRLRMKEVNCNWKDEITGEARINQQILDFASTQVLIKSDGFPTYNFATVVDDHFLGITDIIRGTDHINNTYKQVAIYDLLEWDLPKFHHVGLVCNLNGGKLSKRDSDALNLFSYNKEALYNYVLRLGWSPYIDDKSNNIIDRDKAIKMFWTEGKLKSSNMKIDEKKLKWYDKKYKNR